MPVITEKTVAFINGQPTKCGCQIRFSSGHGEYSDVHYLTPCTQHGGTLFGPAEVSRDKDGWWYHPGIPKFDGGEDPAPYLAWVAENNLQLNGWHMDADLASHPYFEGACHCNGWEPESPGPEWFLMGIFDTKDGPYVQWARRIRT